MKKTKKLNISAVICTRNRNKYLKVCMISLLKQSYPLKEIIIVEDKSTSDMNIFKFFEKEFFNIIYNMNNLFNFRTKIILLRNNQQFGIAKSRNLGIKVSKGDIIAFLDDDSFAHKDWIKNLVRNYKSNKIFGVGGPFIEIGRKNLPTLKKRVKNL